MTRQGLARPNVWTFRGGINIELVHHFRYKIKRELTIVWDLEPKMRKWNRGYKRESKRQIYQLYILYWIQTILYILNLNSSESFSKTTEHLLDG